MKAVRPAPGSILFAALFARASMTQNARAVVFGQGADMRLLIKYSAASMSRRLRPLLAMSVILLLLSTGLLTQISPVRAQQAAGAGNLDTTFGSDGEVTSEFFGFYDQAQAIVLQPDGMLVAAGSAATQTNSSGIDTDSFEFALARYNTAGNLDTTFGNGGKVTTGFFGFEDVANALVLQPDGKIVAAGYASKQTNAGNKNFNSQDFALARYNTDGSLDTTFGTGGTVTTDFFGFQDQALAVALQPDGMIVAAGFATMQGNTVAAAVRYSTDGGLDTTFGSGGKVTTTFFGNGDVANAVAIQTDGEIVIAGSTADEDFALARYKADGSLDSTFGGGGKVFDGFGLGGDNDSIASCMAIQPDGKIVAAGNALDSNQVGDVIYISANFAVARYNTDGSLDSTFGNSGHVVTSGFSSGNLVADLVEAIALQPDGKIVAAGSELNGSQFPEITEFAIARYNTDGSLDSTFGNGGEVSTEISANSQATAVVLQPDATIVLAGSSTSQSGGREFVLARYLAGPIAGDYSVTATPVSQTISAGKSTSYTLNLQSPSAISVSLSASVSPSSSGMTTSFTEASVNSPGASTLNVTTTKATPIGTYTVTVTSTAGSVTQFTTVTLIVSGPDFSLGFAESTITAQPGTKVSAVVSIDRLGGDTGKVTVTPPTAPAGIKVKPPSPISTTGNSAAFKLKIAGSAAAGSYPLTFTGKDSSGRTHSATLTLVVQ
jgi:uncharacterized delta-60 repeat protein